MLNTQLTAIVRHTQCAHPKLSLPVSSLLLFLTETFSHSRVAFAPLLCFFLFLGVLGRRNSLASLAWPFPAYSSTGTSCHKGTLTRTVSRLRPQHAQLMPASEAQHSDSLNAIEAESVKVHSSADGLPH